MRRPTRTAAAATALSVALSLAGCAASTTDGAGTAVPGSTSARSGGSGGTTAGTSAAAPSPTPSSTLPALTGRSTGLFLDAGFLSALTSLRLTPGVAGTARLVGTTLVLPVTGGHLVAGSAAVRGQVMHAGSGVSLSNGRTTVSLNSLVVDYDAATITCAVLVNGATAVASARIFALDESPQRTTSAPGSIFVSGTRVSLSPDGAALLDKVFGTTAVKAGQLVGTLTVMAFG